MVRVETYKKMFVILLILFTHSLTVNARVNDFKENVKFDILSNLAISRFRIVLEQVV